MKIVILTRTAFHHTSFINRLQEEFEVACVVREQYPATKTRSAMSRIGDLFQSNSVQRMKDAAYLKSFFKKYSAGFRYHSCLGDFLKTPFDVVIEKPGTRYMQVASGEINSKGFASFIQEIGPDIVAVLGSSVILPHLIAIPSVAMINLHSGLSPYYRGTWSFGWPLVNREPEYIGVTIHHVNAGIDTGDIISQARPGLEGKDDLNAIFLKVISSGIELMVQVIGEFRAKGKVPSYPQPSGKGRLYLMKQFNAEAARQCLSNLEEGLLAGYCSRKHEMDERVPLVGHLPLGTVVL